ncbi:MAG: hypothetical protein IT530_16155 [Burkholderiales bacterium]|nr:hypothetical protein [Burkholderiales bacterium]
MARKPGSRTAQPRNVTVRARAWQAMRSLRVFDLGQVMSVSEIERWNAAKFIRALAYTGFLREVASANPGRRMCTTWRLVRDCGPRAPVIRSMGEVFDPNSGLVYARVGTVGWTVKGVEGRQ